MMATASCAGRRRVRRPESNRLIGQRVGERLKIDVSSTQIDRRRQQPDVRRPERDQRDHQETGEPIALV